MLRSPRSLPLILAATALVVVPAAADAKPAKKRKVAYPTITSVAPLKLKVGDTLTIRGTNFKPGRGKTTVVFQRTGKPAIFVKSATSTRRVITVTLPVTLGAFLVTTKDGSPLPTTFKLRVLAAKFSRSWTSTKTSPTIAAKPVGATDGTSSTLTAYQQCQEDALASPSSDSDHDGLINSVEVAAGTDPCKDDTDGDGVTDGYEYYSATDLNGAALPYPGTRPWPNPLDNTDAADDFDGDGLTTA